MTYDFKLPDIGEGLTEGEIVKWLVKEGDQVSENQPLCNVLTDKAEVEIPSPKAGKVVKLFAKPGEKVKVHAPLVTFELGGNGASKPAAAAPAPKPAAKPDHEKTQEIKPAPAKAAAPAAKTTPSSAAPAAAAAGSFSFKLPDIGEGLTEGEVVKWHVKEGDTVSENQALCNVLTDKAEVEIPSPKSGKIVKLYAKPGEKVKVHAPLVDFQLVGGKAAGETPVGATKAAEASHGAKPVAAGAAPAKTAPPASRALATPMVRQLAKSMGVDIDLVHGSGPEGRVLETDLKAFASKGGAAQAAKLSTGPVNATEAVKKLAAELGVNLSGIQGTGPGGRIAEWDVRKLAGGAVRVQSAPTPSRPLGPVTFSPASAPSTGEERTPFVGIRRKIAERMHQSVSTAAHVTHMDECDMTEIVELRAGLKDEAAKRGAKLTFLPFIIRALCKTLKEFPQFNASLDEAKGEIVTKRFYNLGIAVNAGQGLVVPNIKGADGKDLWSLAAEISALAEKVRAGKIDVASLQGGTFTLTNIGPIGGLFATPIINHPEVAILGLMKLQKRPVARDGGIQVRDMMNLVLSFDHRVLDGADAASFMNTLIKHLENPRTIL
jgi:pyruvate dehydrogenase E2 component (dihydrolipoamide acetyltransferase)